MRPPAKQPISLRINQTDLAEIDQLAREHGLNRTNYIVQTALGRLDTVGINQRLQDLEHRVDDLDRRLNLAYG